MKPHRGRNTAGLCTCNGSTRNTRAASCKHHGEYLQFPGKHPKLCGTIKARKQFQLFNFLQDFKDRNSSQSFQNILADTYHRTLFWHQSQQNQFFSSSLGTQTLKQEQVGSHVPTLNPFQLCGSLFKSQEFW